MQKHSYLTYSQTWSLCTLIQNIKCYLSKPLQIWFEPTCVYANAFWSFTFVNTYINFYFLHLVIVVFLWGLHTCQRPKGLKPCKLSPSWQPERQLVLKMLSYGLKWNLSLIPPSPSDQELLQTATKIYKDSCRGSSLLVLALRCDGQTSQDTHSVSRGLRVCDCRSTACTLRSPERRYAR